MQFIWLINTGWVCEWILQNFHTQKCTYISQKCRLRCRIHSKLINKTNDFYGRPVIKWSFNKCFIACMVVHQMSIHSVSSSLPIFFSHIHSAVRDVTVAWQLCNCRCLWQHHTNGLECKNHTEETRALVQVAWHNCSHTCRSVQVHTKHTKYTWQTHRPTLAGTVHENNIGNNWKKKLNISLVLYIFSDIR